MPLLRPPEIVILKILIADDSATVRLILTGMLKKLGHEVVAVADGLEAWDTFQREYFPVVIADWQMPRIDGLVLCSMMRLKPMGRYSYLILITAHGAVEHYTRGIEAGADDFLAKPFDESMLAARLLVANRIVSMQNHAKQLEGLMSVCSYCRNIRNDANLWVRMEDYASNRFGVKSSHGICPTCFTTRVKPELEQLGISTDEIARTLIESAG